MKHHLCCIFIPALLFFSCAKSQDLQTVDSVDIEKYLGQWYEVASFPASFQKGCRCTTAEYLMEPGKNYIRVINKCLKLSKSGSKMTVAKGKAFPVKGSGNARLKVQFFWPFKGDYYIIELAGDYSFAVVGHPERNYLWILSREPYMTKDTYNMLLEKIRQKGFDISRLQLTEHNCEDR
jgi:apolipoprotein D and lipocalin family protein